MAGLYIHVPFCKQACHYCDFHFSTQRDYTPQLCEAIIKELELQKNFLGEPLETIYFGGGTPSLLSFKQLGDTFNHIFKNYTVSGNAEVTLEANPDDLTFEYVKELNSVGINRLSIGIQSFDDRVLKFLNRSHNGSQALKAIETSRAAGISNLNVDLIYAIPNRNQHSLVQDLNQLKVLRPDHISAYSLTVEPKTVFGNWTNAGKFAPETEEENAVQFELVMDYLAEAGYDHYEISNYSLPGRQSLHNSNYWRQKKYLGIGPSAHSYNGKERWINVANNHTYIKTLAADSIPATVEPLTPANQINEYIMTSLRTMWGCDVSVLQKKFQYNLIARNKIYFDKGIAEGLFTLQGEVVTLTRKGRLFADSIAAEFFVI